VTGAGWSRPFNLKYSRHGILVVITHNEVIGIFLKKGKTPQRFHLCIFPLLIAVPIFSAFTGGQQDRNILEPCASTETLSK